MRVPKVVEVHVGPVVLSEWLGCACSAMLGRILCVSVCDVLGDRFRVVNGWVCQQGRRPSGSSVLVVHPETERRHT